MKLFKKTCLIFFLIFLILACKKNDSEKKENTYSQNENYNLNFDKVLKVNEYVCDVSDYGSFFTTSYDNGITYNPKKENDLGNLVTFLIPKDFLFFQKHSKYINKDDYGKLQDYINKLSIEEYKKAFDIYVFFIDKKYLVPTSGGDSAYNVTEKYQTDLYRYKNNSWEKIDSFIVDSDGKDKKEMNWRINFIEKKSNELRITFLNSVDKLKIDNSWYRDYILPLDSYEPSYSYTYYVKISKDSSYIAERSLKDLLVPYQNADTLFLYHKKNLLVDSKYLENIHLPEVKIVKVKDKYYINSEVFDLKNSISTKPAKYGFLVDEIN